jgi:acyl carrier protein
MNDPPTTLDSYPFDCPICGGPTPLDFSNPSAELMCAGCGEVLSWFRERLSRQTGIPSDRIRADSYFAELGVDALDLNDLLVQYDGEFGVHIPDDDAEQFAAVEDVIRYLNRMWDADEE